MNPPPPGAAGEAADPDDRVIKVPAGTLIEAVAEFEFPDAEVVEKLRIGVCVVDADQIFEVVEGVTVSRTHVVVVPV
jgi:hypothetical protein